MAFIVSSISYGPYDMVHITSICSEILQVPNGPPGCLSNEIMDMESDGTRNFRQISSEVFTLINLTHFIRVVVNYPFDFLNSIIKINMQQNIFLLPIHFINKKRRPHYPNSISSLVQLYVHRYSSISVQIKSVLFRKGPFIELKTSDSGVLSHRSRRKRCPQSLGQRLLGLSIDSFFVLWQTKIRKSQK